MRKNGLILTDHFVLETGKYRKMESQLNAHMQRCIHLFIEMEEKDVIYRLVKGVYIFFKLQKMPSVWEVAWILAYFQTGGVEQLPQSPALWRPQLLPACPTNREPSSGEGGSRGWANIKLCISSGMDVPRGSASPFASLLCQPICLASSLHEEVIGCDTVLSTA